MSKPVSALLKIGTTLNDRWVILDYIDKGAMGEVYHAHQLNLKRDIAIKVISQEWLENQIEEDQKSDVVKERFQREVKALAQVRHPNVIQVYDYGSAIIIKEGQEVPIEYLAMEYVPGATLRYTMPEEGFIDDDDDENRVKNWLKDYFLPTLNGVEAMHSAQIIHRDLKPENILLDGNTPKIADFGLARSGIWKPITRTMDMFGTMPYMSPEHYMDFKSADKQADIYSMGKILFEAVSGKITSKVKPFKTVGLENPQSPFFIELDQIIQKATAEEKEARYSNIKELHSHIQALFDNKTTTLSTPSILFEKASMISSRNKRWVGVIVFLLFTVSIGFWYTSTTFIPGQQSPSEEFDRPTASFSESKHDTVSIDWDATGPPPEKIIGNDGRTMLLVSKNHTSKPFDEKSDTLMVTYLDEQPVTTYNFVEFLNEVKSVLIVEEGVVKSNNKIWLYLGQDGREYEQIIYQHGRFHLRDIKRGDDPIVRVTWYGASAYTKHYGRRLPLPSEWVSAVPLENPLGHLIDNTNTPSKDKKISDEYSHHMDMDMDMNSKPGLSDKNNQPTLFSSNLFREWVRKSLKDYSVAAKNIDVENDTFHSLIAKHVLSSKDIVLKTRYPWEAFHDVGFRGALSITK